jgi:hypothetical protein
MSQSELPLLRQLSANSDPYRDPLVVLDWGALALDRYWLPPVALSLYGLPEFASLSETARIRLSQLEMLGYAQAGIALERIFLELTASRLRRVRESAEYAFLLHEMREEAGHSLMFLKLAAASGLAMPDWRSALPRSARPVSRLLLSGALYWAMLVIGQDIPDKLNRFVRRHAGDHMTPLIRQMITLHMVDEARHIAYARQRLDAAMERRGRVSVSMLRAVLERLFNQFVRSYFWPRAELYECAGLGDGRAWRRLALRSPHRREFVLRLVAPTMRLLTGHGLSLKLH